VAGLTRRTARVHPAREKRSQPVSTQWERQQKAREEKLKNIEEQVADGSLVIRKMTDEERKANPPKPPREKKPYKR
jgi:hypothetical protein